jgi:hypothetical protein
MDAFRARRRVQAERSEETRARLAQARQAALLAFVTGRTADAEGLLRELAEIDGRDEHALIPLIA